MQADDRMAALLLESTRVSREQLADAQRLRARDKSSLGAVLVRMGLLSETEYEQLLSKLYGVPTARLDDLHIPRRSSRSSPRRWPASSR